MLRGLQLDIKFAFVIIFSQHFCPQLSEKEGKKMIEVHLSRLTETFEKTI